MVCITGLQVNMNLLYVSPQEFLNISHHICSRVMWEYLEHIAVLLSNLGEVLHVMPQSEAQFVRWSLSHGYSPSDRHHRVKLTPCTRSKAVPFVTGDDGKLLPGVFVIVV